MADDIEAGIRLTPPYGKSATVLQMRHAIAAMQHQRLQKGPAQRLHKQPPRQAE
jgi:hypothetical protein